MHLFEQSMFAGCEHTMRGWPKEAAADAYAIAMMVSFTGDDIRKPDISLVCNTEGGWKNLVESGVDPQDARWNEILWYKAESPSVCITEAIRAGGYEVFRRRLEFLKSATDSFDFSEDEYSRLTGGSCWREHADLVDKVFVHIVDLCGRIVQRLHNGGFVTAVCGKSVPIIIYPAVLRADDSYVVQQNLHNNPAALIAGYEEYRCGGRALPDRQREIYERVAHMPIAAQARYWISAMRGFCLDQPTRESLELSELNMTPLKVKERLVAIGPAAIGPIVLLLEYTARIDYIAGAPGMPRAQAIAYDSLTSQLLNAVIEIGAASDEDRRRLQRLFQIVYRKTEGCPQISGTVRLLAAALHTLVPSKFASPQCNPDTNKLLNSGAYGV